MKLFGAYLFDLDGVLYRGKTPLPGATDTVQELARCSKVAFLTNNSGRHRSTYVERLRDLGFPADEQNVFSSGWIAARRLREMGIRTVFVIGMEGLIQELQDCGITVVEDGPADAVLVGRDVNFTYQKLAIAQRVVLAGAKLFSTNRDFTYPVEDGVQPGSGAILAAVEAACMREAKVFGKPEPDMIYAALSSLGVSAENAVMVGDRLDTDILCARRAGVQSVLVLTGVTTREEAEAAPPEMRPDYIINHLPDILP